jgi:hypothetical protein
MSLDLFMVKKRLHVIAHDLEDLEELGPNLGTCAQPRENRSGWRQGWVPGENGGSGDSVAV